MKKEKLLHLSSSVALLFFFVCSCTTPHPKGFAPIVDYVPEMLMDLRYATSQNFMGRPVEGYATIAKVLTVPTLEALAAAQQEYKKLGLSLILYDGYRPQRAVDDFMAWSKILGDTLMKKEFYPDLPKATLFDRGYIASKSGHSRGSTIDVSLVYSEGPKKGKELDMGSRWDFFGPISWVQDTTITAAQQKNRKLLSEILQKHGFRPYAKEWWHFTLEKEPFPNTYFDF
jgi:D-alanyl-D-alanine dipeptidase